MRIRAAIFMFAFSVWLAPASTTWAAGINVLEWTLRTDVSIGSGNDGRVQTAVVNPLQHTYFASLQNSTAQSVINAAWDDAGNFDFLIDGEQVVQGGDSNTSRSSGSFNLIPEVDSDLTIDAEYNYALGNGIRSMELHLGVFQPGAGSVYSSVQRALSIAGDPLAGTRTKHVVIPLEAGVEYSIGYGMTLQSFSGSPTSLSHGDGFAHFSIVPVPEPASALLLAFAGAALLQRPRQPALPKPHIP